MYAVLDTDFKTDEQMQDRADLQHAFFHKPTIHQNIKLCIVK